MTALFQTSAENSRGKINVFFFFLILILWTEVVISNTLQT